MSQITSFLGEHFFLSNFYHYKPFIHDSCLWRTSEHTFQAIKCSDYTNWLDACEEGHDSHEAMEANSIWKAATPQEARDLGQQCKMHDDWEQIKERVMFDILWSKFFPGSELSKRLAATGGAELIESNDFGDVTWGAVLTGNSVWIDPCWQGKNKLGKILMAIRGLQR